MSLKVRPGILDIAAYVPGDHSLPGEGPVYRMASNESALGPSPKAVEAYRALSAELHRYPDGASKSLRAGARPHLRHRARPDRVRRRLRRRAAIAGARLCRAGR